MPDFNPTAIGCICQHCMTNEDFQAAFGFTRDNPEWESLAERVLSNRRLARDNAMNVPTEVVTFQDETIVTGSQLTLESMREAMDAVMASRPEPLLFSTPIDNVWNAQPVPIPLFNYGAFESAWANKRPKLGATRRLSPKFKLKDGVVRWNGVKVFTVNREAKKANPDLPCNLFDKRTGNNLRDLQETAKYAYKEILQELGRERTSAIHVAITNNRPGRLMRRFLQPRIEAIDRNKKPKDQKRHLGIEIEFIADSSQSEVIEAFAKARLDEYVTYHTDSSVGSDGDCGGDNCDGSGECNHDLEENEECEAFHCSCDGGNGHEICVLVPTPLLESVIERVCKVLNDTLSARVDKTCGLHVHLDARRSNKEGMYNRLVQNVDFLMSMLPGSRRNNSYCRVNPKDRTLKEMIDGSDRYWAINPQSISEHGTVEIRAHSGTTDPIKIVQWIKLISFIAYTRKDKPPIVSFNQLVAEGMNLHTVLYFAGRWNKFKDHKRGNWTPTDLNEMTLGQLNERDAEVA